MDSQLKKAVINHQQEKIEEYLKKLETDNSFSLASLIEDLLSLMLMECSLRYGSFHFVKMSLFLRELSQKNYFSRESELEIAGVVVLGLSERHFINLEADSSGYKEKTQIAESYQQFKDNFSPANYKDKLDFLFYNLDQNYKETVNYLHRLFAEYYNPSWNPHYYTGLYCALGLYKSEKINDNKVKKMAVIQAVEYFADNVL
ncbi:hypothetical protein [Halanaerobium congolense]|jgi:hypothetical protein|uniref:hypothetical protein n=1 Tax=Halanaerobium congolense TaxID=54121 RepID=UPI00087F268C|nr:hypothetical protein [Halanaerobium congolense]SDH13152.1 hypothetical protein SAMN04515651_10676 [Halanaerobium congolense]